MDSNSNPMVACFQNPPYSYFSPFLLSPQELCCQTVYIIRLDQNQLPRNGKYSLKCLVHSLKCTWLFHAPLLCIHVTRKYKGFNQYQKSLKSLPDTRTPPLSPDTILQYDLQGLILYWLPPKERENGRVVKNNITEELDTQEEKYMLARNSALPSLISTQGEFNQVSCKNECELGSRFKKHLQEDRMKC